jgi:DNA-directed RNA polymerase
MELLSEVLRKTFIKLYNKNDVLQNFADEQTAGPTVCKTMMPEFPKYGTLNLNEVKDAEFFFS